MSGLTNDQLTAALAAVAVLTILSLVVTLLLGLRLKTLHRRLAVMRGDGRDVDVVGVLARAIDDLTGVSHRLDALTAEVASESARRRRAVQHFGLVRYDAFAEMGGRLSFSAALLDDHGDGIVITSINGRTETRTYAKDVRGGASQSLSHEEREAIELASSNDVGSIEALAR